MRYHVKIEREGAQFSGIFVDAPGCMTQGSTEAIARERAREALEEWLRAHLENGMVPPRPRRTVKGAESVEVEPAVAVAVQFRWARVDAGMTQAQAARAAKVTQQQIAKIENPNENPTVATITKVARALGSSVDLVLTRRAG